MHRSIFNTGNRQKILCQIYQPHRIVINGSIYFLLLFFWKRNALFHQNTCISTDAGKRCPQIMRNCSKQIRAQPFSLCFQFDGLVFFLQSPTLQNDATFIQNSYSQIFFKNIHLWIVSGRNCNYSHNSLYSSNGKIQILCMRQRIRSCTGSFIIFYNPVRHTFFFY